LTGSHLGGKVLLLGSILLIIIGIGLIVASFYTVVQTVGNVGDGGVQDITQLRDYVSKVPKGELNETEIEGILYMREEEKLARDVYQVLYDRWGSQIYQNIAHSEQIHMDAVSLLIEKYGLEDPVVNDSIGAFTNPKFKDLYEELVANGSKSLESAYRVGCYIEEIDIIDLDYYIAKTDNEDLKAVFEFLRFGSYNHLRAFSKQLSNLGITYEPILLDKDRYNEIISSTKIGGGAYKHREKRYYTSITYATYYLYGGLIILIMGIALFALALTRRKEI